MNSIPNPFSFKTPENLTAKDIASLFIDVFSDFPRLLSNEHTFLHGARGTGKSMMLRYLEPSVQIAAKKVRTASELEFYAVHMPIKTPNYFLSELERLEGAPYWLLAEHFIVLNAVLNIIKSIENLIALQETQLSSFFYEIKDLADNAGCTIEQKTENPLALDYLRTLNRAFSKERGLAQSYIGQLSFTKELIPYNGSLFNYEGFFLPFIKAVKNLDITPNGPIFLMLDDADNLPVRMQKIVNGWVSYRTTNDICLKVSTQQKYRTWRTPQGILIERSHDFSEIDISAVYTSQHFSHYYDRVEKIVRRRLEIAGYKNTDPLVFFPTNPAQDQALDLIKNRISNEWKSGKKVSSRMADDIRRYTVSEYLKDLAKIKKTNMYSYAGFRSMVDISSGLIRFFLEPASRMYAEILATSPSKHVEYIPPEIQDRIIYKSSEEYILEEFDKLKQDEFTISVNNTNKVERLKRLVNAIGECFQKKLVSDDTERQLISFMISRPPSESIQEVLDLAVEWGYFNVKSIARKEGVGRNTLYILNRRLAPYFKLDPSGYAAHLSITPEHLLLAVEDPRAFVRERLKENNLDCEQNSFEQQSLGF